MSRYTAPKPIEVTEEVQERLKLLGKDVYNFALGTYNFYYGNDHACGYFFQLEDITDVDHLYDIDQRFSEMTFQEFMYILNEFSKQVEMDQRKTNNLNVDLILKELY